MCEIKRAQSVLTGTGPFSEAQGWKQLPPPSTDFIRADQVRKVKGIWQFERFVLDGKVIYMHAFYQDWLRVSSSLNGVVEW
jgi:hypothetical protein